MFCKSNVKNLFKNKREPGQKIVVANFGLRCNKSDISAFCFCSSSNFPADGDGVEKLGVKKSRSADFAITFLYFCSIKLQVVLLRTRSISYICNVFARNSEFKKISYEI